MSLLNFIKKPKEKVVDHKKSTETIMERQHKLGQQIKDAVDKALLKNVVYNNDICGKSKTSERPITSVIERGGYFIILVKSPEDEKLMGGGIIFEININLSHKGEEFHIFPAPAGDNGCRSLQEAVNFQTLAVKKARTCSRFHQQA